MKKREKKLQLSRETVLRLQSEELRNVRGGTGDMTSCYEPCCERDLLATGG